MSPSTILSLIITPCLIAFLFRRRPHYPQQQQRGQYDLITFERVVDGQNRLTKMQIPREDMTRLVAMTYDRECAERLLAHEVRTNPGRVGRWYIEKVISDLERDRR